MKAFSKTQVITFIASGLLAACASLEKEPPLDRLVAKLVDDTTRSSRAEENAFLQLEAMGAPAVPYLIGHLGDARPLAAREISLVNKYPEAFEAIRHYSPDTVHDAISAILNQVTGQHFVFVYNGASPEDRQENAQNWMVWCEANYPAQAAVCRGAVSPNAKAH